MHGGRSLFLTILLVLTLGCRKEKDETAPTVRIISPAEGTTISLPDTLLVRVDVSDDHTVQSVVIDIQNEQGISVVASEVIAVQGGSTTVERNFIIANERLRSGTYTITARASDGENDGRAFRPINLLEVPWRLRAVFVAPAFNNTSTTIQRMDSTGAVSNFVTVQDFNGIAVDSYSQYLMVAGSQFGPFQAIPTAGGISWQISGNQNDAPEQFTSVCVDPFDGRTYFATRDGYIRGFTGEGGSRFNAQCLTGYRCEDIMVLGDRVGTWQRAIVGGAQILVAYGPAGTVLASLPVDHERVDVFRLNTNSALLFCNEAGIGLIEQLNLDAAGTPDLHTFSEGPITAVARLNDDRFVLALPDRLVNYRYTTNTISTVANVAGVVSLAFDPASGTLFAGQGNDLLSMDPNTGQNIGTTPMGNTVGSILPLQNR